MFTLYLNTYLCDLVACDELQLCNLTVLKQIITFTSNIRSIDNTCVFNNIISSRLQISESIKGTQFYFKSIIFRL